jgi:hypothetical protein
MTVQRTKGFGVLFIKDLLTLRASSGMSGFPFRIAPATAPSKKSRVSRRRKGLIMEWICETHDANRRPFTRLVFPSKHIVTPEKPAKEKPPRHRPRLNVARFPAHDGGNP